MDFLSGYQSGDDEELPSSSSLPKLSAPQLVVYKPNSTVLTKSANENCTAEIMLAPELGPTNPFIGSLSSKATGNKLKVQEVFVEDHFFNESYQSYLHEGAQKNNRSKSNSKGKVLVFVYRMANPILITS